MRRFVFPLLLSLNLSAADWKPISPAELELKTPKIDSNAGAEAIFWDTRVYDMIRSLPYVEHHEEHYVRIKIFNDRGVKERSTVDIPYFASSKMTIGGIRARTIKPDGSIVEMKGDAIFDKTNTKIGRRMALKTRSFTLPAVEPGSIIEYQWNEVISEFLPTYVRLEVQREFPIWRVTHLVRPLVHELFTARMYTYPFNCQPTPWELVKTPEPFHRTIVENVPGFEDEPETASDDNLKQWILIYYSNNEVKDPRKFWPKLGREMNDGFKKELKVNGDVKALAAEITAGASTPEEKLNKIADFCRTKIKNVNYETAGITAEERSKFKPKEIQTTADTAKIRIGYSSDVNKLFIALAQASGIEARGVRAGSADYAYFQPNLLDPYLLRHSLAAAKVGTEWKFYNVTDPYIAPGMVRASEEGMAALILDDKEPALVNVPNTDPSKTVTDRKAVMKLNEDGSLEGKVTITLTGHRSVESKNRLESLSDAKREENLKEVIRAIHGEAEVTNITIQNVTDPLQPLIYTYDVKIASYAQRTGKRLFFAPNFFAHGSRPRFPNQTRKHPIIFAYAFTENDSVDLTVPEGFQLEAAESPGHQAIGPVGHHNIDIGTRGRSIAYRRNFVWGKDGKTQFDVKAYPQLKGAFDIIHQRDTHTLTLRQQ